MIYPEPILFVECDYCSANLHMPLRHSKFQLWVKPNVKKVEEFYLEKGWTRLDDCIRCPGCSGREA